MEDTSTNNELLESFDEEDLFSFFFTNNTQEEAEPAPQQEDGSSSMDTSPKLARTPPQLISTQPEKMDFETNQFPPLFPQLEMLIKPEPELTEAIPNPPTNIEAPVPKDEPTEEDEEPAEAPKRKYTRRRATTTTKSTRKKITPSKRGAPTKKKARPAKKQKAGSSDAEDDVEVSPFIASLKGLNSTELEQVGETRALSAKEQSELKKYLRMIKNRESAQLSRERRKVYQDQLEAVLEAEKVKNEALQKKLLELEAQNEVLKGEFMQFRQLIESSNLAKAFSAFSNEKAMVAVTKTAAAGDPKAFTTFAMYLLIALSTFGQKLTFGLHLPKGAQFSTDSVGAVEAQA